MINVRLSQNLKLIGNDEFNHLTIILTTRSKKTTKNRKVIASLQIMHSAKEAKKVEKRSYGLLAIIQCAKNDA
jgi:hypothetical protein